MTLNFVLTKQLITLRSLYVLVATFGRALLAATLNSYTTTLYCRRTNFYLLVKILRFHYYTNLQQLVEMTCVDSPAAINRFKATYMFLSCTFNYRLQVSILSDGFSAIPSLTALFSGSSWQEREAWDMFGVLFVNHPDLRRILTDYGFLGHPLRKDFPLSGFVEVYFNDMTQLVSYQPISLAQEFRDFGRGRNPWVLV